VQGRKLIGFCCVTAVLGLAPVSPGAHGQSPLSPFGVRSVAGNAPGKTAFDARKASAASAGPPSAPLQASLSNSAYLVKEVVYNELHDHDTHGYWRYWIERHSSKETQLEEAVETPDGPVARLELSDGHPISAEEREEEDRRLERLLRSPGEQAQHRKEYADDEHRIGRILALLPDAFLYEPVEVEARTEEMAECPCYHLRFRPNADYPAHSIESRIFHAMTGDLWISVQNKRLVRLDGRLQENVDFGYGILGRFYKDGWFRLERTYVSAGENSGSGKGDWKTQRLEVHMTGRAMLFKTIARETSEVRGGFTPVPSGLSLGEAAVLVREPMDGRGAKPVAMATSR
jgi:hypothetical protein